MAGAFTTLMVFVAIIVALGAVLLAGWRVWAAQSVQGKAVQGGGALALGVAAFMVCLFVASFRPVPTGQVAVIDKKMFGDSLSGGRIIATNGEMGIQDEILRDGWHSGYLPFLFELEYRDLLEVPSGSVGVINTTDGVALPSGQFFAPEWGNAGDLLDAETFLSAREGDQIGYKGEQATVLLPGTYAFNFKVYNIETVPAATVAAGQVGVIKSNIGEIYANADQNNGIVPRGYRGIWSDTYPPGIVPLNPRAFETIKVPTTVRIVDYTQTDDNNDEFTQIGLEDMIVVKTRDGYIFPVDVRVEYRIEPVNAPSVVSQFYNESKNTFEVQLRQKINSTVRSVFRNNAETAEALDYINQRSQQESQSLAAIRDEMQPFGVTILRVAIGDIDPNNESPELTALLKTQTDRQLAIQEEITFKQQQAAAREQQKLNDEQQRALEAKRLATAEYDAQIAEQTAARAEKEAEGRARAVRVEAEAEAFAIRQRTEAEAAGILALQRAEAQGYLEKAQAVGGSNLAMIELFERIATGQVDITPDIVVGGGGESGTVGNALGTMLLQRLMSGDPLIDIGVPPAASVPAETPENDS
jgi:regulator of protease activity HflC (stomatin/prohibitin superfamily)